MFSIAAINDAETSGQWEPLAPTKEAQEFQLSQTYHEGLLKLQAKDYQKAQELLEAVLEDPLLSSSKVNDSGSDGHLSEIRFLSLKNLATVFLQQGSMHYENALQCYLQAVEIDPTDSVVWNQLGTLSCAMGFLSTSRWAFEQGLLCSPNNWNCMEKLLEVLIAIGDEVACLSVADMILRHWPSHSRAVYVKKTIEDAEPIPFAPRGVDKLEPKHVRLEFTGKRKAADDAIDENAKIKRHKQSIELLLSEATWAALTDAILGILLHNIRKHSDDVHDHDEMANDSVANKHGIVIYDKKSTNKATLETSSKIERCTDIKIDIHLSSSGIIDTAEGGGPGVCAVSETLSLAQDSEKKSQVKEKESSADKEHPQERRSTRLESLRSRKSEKEESEPCGKDQAKVVFQFLGPFTLGSPKTEGQNSSDCSGFPSLDSHVYPPVEENKDVKKFISQASRNCGAYHIGHLLLEEVAGIKPSFQDSFVKFLELEKLTRHWGQDRTPLCSLFLAELYYDQGSRSANESKQLELFSDASYHLCKVIESVTLETPYDLASNCLRNITEMNGFNKIEKPIDFTGENGHIAPIDLSQKTNLAMPEYSDFQESIEHNTILTKDTSFWIRFFWLSGRLSLFSGFKPKAFNEFCLCLSLLKTGVKFEEAVNNVFLPHCKSVRMINTDKLLHEINLLRLDAVLGKSTDEMSEKGVDSNCIDFLAPLLLSKKDVPLDVGSTTSTESGNALSVELSALNVLLLACEKEEPLNIRVFLSCHRRKLQLLAAAASMVDSPSLQNGQSSLPKTTASDLDGGEAINKEWVHMVIKEVKDISQSASRVKRLIDQCDTHESFSSLVCIIGDIQSLLLTVMYSVVRGIVNQKSSSSGATDQSNQQESWSLVDAAIAFCKLQHLDPSVPVKTQVDLIVAVHDLLAEYGLCCAGRNSEGEEGAFLKLAINHLLALDVKLKSLNGTTGKEKNVSLRMDTPEYTTPGDLLAQEEHALEKIETEKDVSDKMDPAQGKSNINLDASGLQVDSDLEDLEEDIENALNQCFFCLYGLNINPDSLSEDDLVIHKNTNRGDYQTKEQCADVFHYILPYAGAASRAGLVKLRKVLRAIRKHFPQPPNEILADNAIEKFLDSSDLCEDKLCDISGFNGGRECIMDILFPNGRGSEAFKASVRGSEPYLEVYGNLYFIIAQAEEISATDKYAGFVLKKEGEEFVEHNANLFKYDLLYNPLRFESWQKLANIYDEEVDLLLNDGSKHVNVVDWRRNSTLPQRVDIGRRRSRRCFLMSLALASTPVEKSQILELLALVYYDSLQNVVPSYDQRSVVPTKDAAWMTFCQNSMKHFEKAFLFRSNWLHAFYLGKLCEKLGFISAKAFSYYKTAASLNPSAVDPVYRIHASRLKLLYTQGKQNLDALQIVAAYAFNRSTKETIMNMFNWSCEDLIQSTLDVKDISASHDSERKSIEQSILDRAWYILYDDCLAALAVCVEGELKHFHKARYRVAQGLYRRNEGRDLERAKEELSFCFKSSRSSFTINMWEIDGATKKGRRKNPGLGGNKRNLEVSLSESSRKFITCIRKYLLLYLNLLEKTGDLCTLERAYVHLRTDKRFSLCLGDIVPVALGKYIQVLTSAIRNAEIHGATNNTEQMLEKMFNIFMDNVNFLTDMSTLPELTSPDVSESSLYGYIHQYIHLLESDVRLDALEGINEKIRKRFKNPKLSSSNIAKVCKHASLAWCRSILVKLVLISPMPDGGNLNSQPGSLQSGQLLFVDLQPDDFFSSSREGPVHARLDMNHYEIFSKIKNLCIGQVSEENMESAVTLMRCAYNFYKETSCALPSGINLYTVLQSQPAEGMQHSSSQGVDILDLSIPRKLLLWAYTLVHGRYLNISAVVKYCEENAKSRMKRGTLAASALSQAIIPSGPSNPGSARHDRYEYSEVEDNTSVATPSAVQQDDVGHGSNVLAVSDESQRTFHTARQLLACSTTKGAEINQEGLDDNHEK